ncbi:glutamate-1-semialdehyde 2,1-aminomutase [Thalassoroseus pseudoceratinae]|uniref:glutamate-1-semialdehyde 2,1-aminomutase n=1 Tax=Thalassoroseus pseudoceratinae TaxID=2713176 RepID=UPI00141DA5CE|nr:glutamate-1-semialdehyde 2,1-aminomutase [Thalassoroseus pseudoceratinae]
MSQLQDQSLRTNFELSKQLQQRSHQLVPGGAHTYAKGDDQFPTLSPGFISHGQGCHVFDLDGNEYIEYGMGCRAVTLGHAFPKVVDAARAELERGCNFSRPSPLEFEVAEELLSVITGADMVKFAKDGSDVTSAALKLARAHTGRSHIAYCSDHPFFATNDWFIGQTPMDAGIPAEHQELSLSFRYNDLESVRQLFANHQDQIAAVILEPAKYEDPQDAFLHQVQELCVENGTVFILDEMITGFRWNIGGGQREYQIIPDLSCWGKALANGFSVSALTGKRELMELGGLHHDRERVFLLSTTHGAETHALAAALATIQTYRTEPVIETLYEQGRKLKEGLDNVIRDFGLSKYVQIHGRPCALVYHTLDSQQRPSQWFRALFMQEIIKRGILGPSFIISYSHSDSDVQRTIDAVEGALPIYREALENGVENYVDRPTASVYRKYN